MTKGTPPNSTEQLSEIKLSIDQVKKELGYVLVLRIPLDLKRKLGGAKSGKSMRGVAQIEGKGTYHNLSVWCGLQLNVDILLGYPPTPTHSHV